MEKPGARPGWQEEAHLGTPNPTRPGTNPQEVASPACQAPWAVPSPSSHPSWLRFSTLLNHFGLWVPPCRARVSPRSPSPGTNLCKSSFPGAGLPGPLHRNPHSPQAGSAKCFAAFVPREYLKSNRNTNIWIPDTSQLQPYLSSLALLLELGPEEARNDLSDLTCCA